MRILYPMYRTNVPGSVAVSAAPAAHLARAGGLDGLARAVDGVPDAAEGVQVLTPRGARRRAVPRVVVERVAVVGDLLRAVRPLRRRQRPLVEAAPGAR